MNTVLDAIGPAIWRASWQAAALAVLVVLLLQYCGERLAPRWRFLMWGVVLALAGLPVRFISRWLNRSSRAAAASPAAPRESAS